MSSSERTVAQLDTPALVVDVELARRNIRRAQQYANAHHLRLRPHIKTHKLPLLARLQLEEGACGINCQKISEAHAIVEGLGPSVRTDVLLTFNIVGARKLERLADLAALCTRLTVVADSFEVLRGYAEAAARDARLTRGGERPLRVMVECDTGGRRAGVPEPAAALALARQIAHAGPTLEFAGLMTFPAGGDRGRADLAAWLSAATAVFAAGGEKLPAVSVGGTANMWQMHEVPGITEMRPGTYVYNDRATLNHGAAEPGWCAQTVLTTVVSRPTPLRAVCDAGSKALSSDTLGLDGFGSVREYPAARVARLSEEHGVLEADRPEDLPDVGERIHILPNHACVVTNLFNTVNLIDDLGISEHPIPARGLMH